MGSARALGCRAMSDDILDIGVCIDPGHGGTDHGTTRGGLREADITLDVARWMADALAMRVRLVVPTRLRDVAVTLAERSAIANKHGVGAFVSLHVNSLPWHTLPAKLARVRGGLCFYAPSSVRGRDLAVGLAKAVKSSGIPLNPGGVAGVGPGNFQVLRATEAPAVLVELGFATHVQDRKLLVSPIWQRAVGEALADAVVEWAKPHARLISGGGI